MNHRYSQVNKHNLVYDWQLYIQHLIHTFQGKDLYISDLYKLIDLNILCYWHIQVYSLVGIQWILANKSKMVNLQQVCIAN